MIVGLLGPGGCGGTFLDWTLHYISCNNTNRVIICDHATNRSTILKEILQQVTTTPLKQSTAHNHLKTHPNAQSLHEVVTRFRRQTAGLNTFYFVDCMQPDQTATDYNAIIDQYPDVKFIAYTFTPEDADAVFCLQYEKVSTIATSLADTLKLSGRAPAEQRELLSLYYPAEIRGQTSNELIADHPNSICLRWSDMLYNLPRVIHDIFKFLHLTVDSARYANWLTVYRSWQQRNNVDFYQDLNTITNNIVADIPMDLTKYNITFAKEVAIASRLLYNHNTALQTESAQTLTNTQDWHKITEPNVYHDLTRT